MAVVVVVVVVVASLIRAVGDSPPQDHPRLKDVSEGDF